MYTSFRPGKFWYDVSGALIQAHGGSILYDGEKFWLYGENKSGITGTATGERCPYRHHGLKLYSSADLYNWKDEGFLYPESDDPENPFYPGRIVDRPHVLFNKKTGCYVMWVKTAYKNFDRCTFTVCAGKDLKSLQFVREFTPEPHNAGDFDLFETEGKGYVVFENPHTEMILRELTDDYLGLGEKYSSHLQLGTPPNIREAPCYFERNGRRFLLTSGTTSYFANPSICYDVTDLHGEWKDLGETCVNDRARNSFHAQYASVFRHPFVKDVYIALGDRWLNDCPLDMPDMEAYFLNRFSKDKSKGIFLTVQERAQMSDCDTSNATYVWLPVRFNERGEPYIRWERDWKIGQLKDGETDYEE